MCGRQAHDGHRRRITDIDDAEEIQARRERSVMRHASKMGTIVLICLAIWLVTGAGYFWPAWVLAFGVVKVGLHAREVYSHPVHAEPEYADY
jgi:hypothetical protein